MATTPSDTTRTVRSDGAPGEGPTPRLPHERDESADSVARQPNPDMAQAARDVKRGLVDTDKGPPMDDAYRKQKR